MISDWIHEEFRLDGRQFRTESELIDHVDQRYPEGSNFLRSWLSEEGSIEVSTSGSTGNPKKIRLGRDQMIQSALATGSFFDLKPGSRALLCLPLEFIAGKMMLVRAMVLGWHLSGVEPTVRLDLTEKGEIDFAAMIPLQLERNLDQLERIETLIVGGAPVSTGLQKKIEELPTRIYATYGMTETLTHIALRPLNHSAGRKEEREVFRGLPGVSFETDDRGCLVIRCSRISKEPIVTNDLVECLTQNSFIWRGRIDRVINSGGLKLFPEEIEKKFASCIEGRFFAAGLPDPRLGQSLAFVIEGPEDPKLMQCLKRLQMDSQGAVSRKELPGKLFFLAEFIETGSGKIDRIKTLELVDAKKS